MNKNNVPKIRFNEFSESWIKNNLGDLGVFKSNGVDKICRDDEVPVNLLNYMDVYKRRHISNKNVHELMQVTATSSQLKDNNVLEGDVFFTPTSETADDIGHVMVIEEDLQNTVYSYHLMRFRPFCNSFYKTFPNYAFETESVRNQMSLLAQGVQRFVLSKSQFESLSVYLPTRKDEQEKVSFFFSNIDSLINSTQQKRDHLKNILMSLLNLLFANGSLGATKPKLRFKTHDNEWKKMPLSSLLSFLKDGTHATQNNSSEGPYLLSAKNIKNGKIIYDESDRKISLAAYQEIHKNFTLQPGDVLLTIVGSIGQGAILTDPTNITFQRSVAYLRPSEYIDSKYLYWLTQSTDFQKHLDSEKSMSAQAGVYLQSLASIPCVYSEDDGEQQKIGYMLSLLESLVDKYDTKVELLKNMKSSLLCKMFPN